VAFEEDVAGGSHVDGEFVDLAGDDGFGGGVGVAAACAENPLGDVAGEAVGRDVDELGGEVGIDGS